MELAPSTFPNYMSVSTITDARGIAVFHRDIMALRVRQTTHSNLMIPISKAIFTQTASRSQATRITPIKHTILFEHILTPVKRRILLFQLVYIHIKRKIRRHSTHQRLPISSIQSPYLHNGNGTLFRNTGVICRNEGQYGIEASRRGHLQIRVHFLSKAHTQRKNGSFRSPMTKVKITLCCKDETDVST